MSEFVVAKFGGTSMAQPELPATIAEKRPDQRIIVVSAPGLDDSTTEKMTDTLIRYSSMAADDSVETEGLRDEIVDRFDHIYRDLGERDRESMRQHVADTLRPGRQNTQYYVSAGERLSAGYFARLVGARSVSPAIAFESDDVLDLGKTKTGVERQELSGRRGRIVVPGFFGWDKQLRIRLLGRGGSDRTGALYASALNWDYENWTDVSGVFSADPNAIPGAQVIPELTRAEVREGAHGGTGVLQGDTILDLNGSDTIVHIKNTKRPDEPGSRIVPKLQEPRDKEVIAVSGRDDLLRINIKDMGMADRKGYVARILANLSDAGLSFEHLPASQDSFSITLHDKHDPDAVSAFVDEVRAHSLSSHAEVSDDKAGMVYVVGEGLRGGKARQDATLRVLGSAASNGMIAMPVANVDSPSIAFMVERADVDPLIRLVHAGEILEPAGCMVQLAIH